MELTGNFIGPWNRTFDCVPDLTEEEKEAIYGLIQLSNQKVSNDTKRTSNTARVHPRFTFDKETAQLG
jgi:hypothetical protein